MRFKKVKLPDGNVIVDTGLPQRGIKPVGLNMLVSTHLALISAVAVAQNMENGVVLSLSKALVNSIFDMSKRDEALENIHRLIDEEIGEDSSLSFSERTRKESDIWMEIGIRETVEHMDSAFGISHRLAIGTFGTGVTGAMDEVEEPLPDAGIGEEWKDMEAD
jgi:hypothetical protein